ncbi:hypothetical protein [Saccharothrix xinjiangensis]|uniref:Vitamin K-dependent gamma-carboxylase-like protein n=1 Tax=Saccharothrix xinjiangensis TaxID=204798 RepID=A0ABV9Y265_9PSEU
MFLLLLGAGLLAHVVMYLVTRPRYLTLSFAPALGLRLPRPLFTALQVAGIPVFLVLLATGDRVAGVLALAVYACWVGAQNLRISNHLWLAFLGAAVLVFLPPAEQVTAARLLLGCVYLISGLVKCNRAFLFSETSVGRFVLADGLDKVRLRSPRWFAVTSPFVVVLAELGSGVALLADRGVLAAFLACVALHFFFGVVGNYHFSLVCLAFWYQATGAHLPLGELLGGGHLVVLGVAAVPAVAAYSVVRRVLRSGPRFAAGLSVTVVLTAVYGMAAVAVWRSISAPGGEPGAWGAGPVVVLVVVVANFALLLLGVKSEWAFAMFSNVRPYSNARVFGYRPPWRTTYFRVSWEGGSPEDASGAVPEHVLDQLRDGRHVVSGPVAGELARIAREVGADVRLVPLVFDDAAQSFVDDPRAGAPARGGPILVAPIINVDPAAVHAG